MKEIILTDKAPAPIGPYSQAVLVDGVLYTSGQIPIDPATGDVNLGTIEEQTHQVCKNIEEVLKAAEMSFEDVFKTMCFLANMEDFPKFNGVYGEYFVSKPARSCVAVKELPKGVAVEVEIIAKK